MQTINERLSASESIKEIVKNLKVDLSLITPFITDVLEVALRDNTSLKNSLVFQFSVNDVHRFIEKLKDDLYLEEKKLIEKLDLSEKTKRLARLEKYSGTFSTDELTDTLLHLKQEHNYNLDSAFILMSESIFQSIDWKNNERVTVVNGLTHIYNIPVYTDISWPIKHRCLPSRLICFGDSKQKLKLYRDLINVSSSGIEYYKIEVPLFTPYKILSIKV